MAWERYRITYQIKLPTGRITECRQFTNILDSGEYILKCMENIDTIINANLEERITDGLTEEWKHIHSWTKLED
jgi:hypothetical protein